jgi:hypothetical protein
MTTRNQRRARARKGKAARLAKALAMLPREAAKARASEIASKREVREVMTDSASFTLSGWQREAGALRSVAHKPVDGREAYAALGRTPQGEARFKVVRKVVKAKRFAAT